VARTIQLVSPELSEPPSAGHIIEKTTASANRFANTSYGHLRCDRAQQARTPTPRSSPVTITRPHPDVWREALRLANGNTQRLVLTPDGTILVRNQPHH
jgi:hypothetical protein